MEDLDWVIPLKWVETIWKPKDALVDKNGGTTRLYIGQSFDKEYFDLIKNGWTHDHCDICSSDIREMDKCAISENQIICSVCFNDFIKNKTGHNNGEHP